MTPLHHCGELYPPHFTCWGGDALMVWLHTLADSLIALSYFAIPAALFYLARKHHVKKLSRVFIIYGLFILGCGVTHVFDVLTVWYANYAVYLVDGLVRAATGVVSAVAAYVTVKCAADALKIFTRLAVLERRAGERMTRLTDDPRYDTAEDREAQTLLSEIKDLARLARETVTPEEA